MIADTGIDAPLNGVLVLDCSLLSAGAAAAHLADLGARVIKIEAPGGDYVRQLTWPIIEGDSLMHHEVSRGKQSLVLDLRSEQGARVFRQLAAKADVVIEAMRPGALARRGLGYEDLRTVNPALVFCSISGYGLDGPYRDMPAHGLAFDAWAGLVAPAYDADGYCYIPEHPSVGMHAGPVYAGMAICAALLRARIKGRGAFLEIGQSDAAAYMDRLRSETWKAYERPQTEVTGNASDDFERRAPGTAGMREGVRYQFYETSDGHILFMASEQEFWKNFCDGIDRRDLFERWPGQRYGDHARNNRELQGELKAVFATRSSAQWLHFASQHNTAIAPVNTPQSLLQDPHFKARVAWLKAKDHVADMLPFPVRFVGETLAESGLAPAVGEHSRAILTDLLDYDSAQIQALMDAGVLG